MKKFVLVSILLAAIGIVSCSSCASKPPPGPEPIPTVVVPPPPVPDAAPPVKTVSVTGEGWEFTLPSDGWEKQEACSKNGCLTLLKNDDRMNVILMLKRNNPPASFEEYTLEAVRAAKEEGIAIKAVKQVTLNGHNFVYIDGSKDTAKVWVWYTTSNNKGLEFSCGGPNDDGHQTDLCAGVAATLKIN